MGAKDSDPTGPVQATADLPLLSWDRYKILLLLGQGGMGRVYKAFDPRLKRHVALKLLTSDDPEVRQRFLQEPQAQARIDHPNVCKIYETGEVAGRPFIAMQFIDGLTLDDLKESLSLEQKLLIVRDVAEGIHAAHRLGIIHRDLKPSNIVVEKVEDGLHPYVMDFGLAREISAPGLTATGVILGTPWYMAPEQALGNVHSMDRRCDVYGLGATLYHLVCMRPPFDGTPVEILTSIPRLDPPPPRRVNPSIPDEVETIVLKCLEKDPSRRYDSARSLSEDLSRYLEGEPIQARPPSLAYRLGKKARKNRLAVSIGAAAMLLTMVMTSMWLRARWTAAQQAAMSQQIGQKVEKLEAVLRNIHMLPLHNTTAEKSGVLKQLQELERQIQENMGTLGAGPGNYALGQVLLAQQDDRGATQHLQTAWNTGYQNPEVAYALGRALGALYLQELENARRIGSKELRRKQEQLAERDYREPALRYLQQSRMLKVDSPDYVEALISLYAKQYRIARVKAQAAFQKVPWLYEAKILEGDVLKAQAFEAADQGRYTEAAEISLEAVTAYQAAARIGQSDPGAYKGLCDAWSGILAVRIRSTGMDVDPAAQEVRRFCDQAAVVDSSRADIQSAIAQSYRLWGDYQLEHGQDPRPALQNALSAAKNAIQLASRDASGYVYAGLACWELAKYELDQGGSPEPLFEQSIDYLKRALKLEPNNAGALNSLGLTYLEQGSYVMYKGTDPLPLLDQSATCFRRLTEIDPQYFSATLNLGIVYGTVGEYEKDHGRDPVPSLNRAIDALLKSEKINPNQVYSYRFGGYTYRDLGEHLMHAGLDPGNAFRSAIQWLQTGLRMNPQDAFQYTILSSVYLHQAEQKLEHEQSPATELDSARDAAQRAIVIDPDASAGYEAAGTANLMEARWRKAAGNNPLPALQKAETLFQKALRLNQDDASVALRIAECHLLRAETAAGKRLVGTEIEMGLDWIETSLRLNPQLARAYGDRGILLQMRDRKEQAQEALARAVAINVNLKRYYTAPIRWHAF